MNNEVTRQSLGITGMSYHGEYNASTTYKRGYVVVYDGSSYVATTTTKGNTPTNTNYFQLIARKPIKGTDYFTEQDKQEIVDDVTEDAESDFNQYVEGKKSEFDQNASNKTTAFNNNASSQTTTFNNNVTSKTNDFNTNASSKTSDFDTHVTSKIGEFNTNASNKTSTFNANASDKTTEYNNNADEKIAEFDEATTDYVKNTDYATTTKGGVIIPARGMSLDANGKTQCGVINYTDYQSVTTATFISKGTLDNVITGKGLVSNTDYATNSVGGVIKVGYGSEVDANGTIKGIVYDYSQYSGMTGTRFISKGTLENVITGKNLETANNKVTAIDSNSTDTQYPSAKCVYDLVGDIESILTTLDVGNGV